MKATLEARGVTVERGGRRILQSAGPWVKAGRSVLYDRAARNLRPPAGIRLGAVTAQCGTQHYRRASLERGGRRILQSAGPRVKAGRSILCDRAALTLRPPAGIRLVVVTALCRPQHYRRASLKHGGRRILQSASRRVKAGRSILCDRAALTFHPPAGIRLVVVTALCRPQHYRRASLERGGRRILQSASRRVKAGRLILYDRAARNLRPPTGIRLGVVAAPCGGPFFLVLSPRHYRGASL